MNNHPGSPRRTVLWAVALGLAACLGRPSLAQQWPEKPVRLVHPYAGGAAGDVLTRELAAGLQQELGGSFITENKPGGGTVIGADTVAKSPPDGYNVLMAGPATHVIMPQIHPKLPYNAQKDFDLIGMWAIVPSMISVNRSLPVNNLGELIDYARKNPGKLNYASAGIGTGPHLAGETFRHITQTNMTHVPYKGAAPAVMALLSGEVQVAFVNIPPQMSHVKAGKIRPIAVMSPSRSALMPDVPTAIEQGLAGFISESWYGVAVPAGTPLAVRDRMQQAMFRAGANPDRKARLIGAGIEPKLMTSQQLADYIQSEQTRLKPVLKALDLKVQ
ncbi:MAG: Bug family tripartite tricarboxylate transporter substrate binding protein [Hylemonella sp.]